MPDGMTTPVSQYGALHVFIDAVHHCPGACPGCALSSAERREQLLPINNEYLSGLFSRVRQQCVDTDSKGIAMVYGIGDYLYYDTSQVRDLVQKSVDLIAELCPTGPQDSVVMVSSSLIGKEHHVQQAIEEIFFSINKPDHISTVLKVVFDPLKYRHAGYGNIYAGTFETVGKLVPDSDVVINLSPQAIAAIEPETVYDMMAGFGFRELELPWLITNSQNTPTRQDLEALADWLIALLIHADRDGRVYLTLSELRQHWRKWQGNQPDDLAQTTPTGVKASLKQYMRFDEHGMRWPDYPHTGNACYGSRYYMPAPSWQNSSDTPHEIEKRISSQIMRSHLQHAACRSCPHLAVCATTGFHITNAGLAAKNAVADGDCPNVVAKRFFDYFAVTHNSGSPQHHVTAKTKTPV